MTEAIQAGAVAEAAGAGPAVAQLIDLRKTYFKPDGSVMVEALRGVNISINQGEYVAIMGASGSGKSTLMYLLGCLDRPTSGQYLLDGRDVAQMSDQDLSRFRGRKIGFIFQSFNLIPQLTIEENVEVPLFYQGMEKAERRERAIEALKLVELDHRLGHRPSELSGGQQQRAAIARALVTRPLVLMADEPTGNLDSATGTAILRTFERLHESGMTIVIVTHDPSIGRRAGRVIRMKDGDVESDVEQVRETAVPA
ncbi:MAG: ABC transporter ATP-binding protein [Phycisphaerales bacterium]|nr:ABC transporter ATP-binding protein [Phycisphaerales bacterium]